MQEPSFDLKRLRIGYKHCIAVSSSINNCIEGLSFSWFTAYMKNDTSYMIFK